MASAPGVALKQRRVLIEERLEAQQKGVGMLRQKLQIHRISRIRADFKDDFRRRRDLQRAFRSECGHLQVEQSVEYFCRLPLAAVAASGRFRQNSSQAVERSKNHAVPAARARECS
eukprot:6195616-Pleurochrysis_carterae.AAC.2